MSRTFRWAVFTVFWGAVPAWSAGPKYAIKTVADQPPGELKEPIRKLLGDQAIALVDAKGKAICQVWFRRELPAEAAKEGLTYRDLKETTVVGAIRYVQPATDFRGQKIKAGVYTLRLGFQPMDGDHMGVSPYQDFLLLVPAGQDPRPDLLPPKALYERSAKGVSTSHPGVLMLFPNEKPQDKPQLVSKDDKTWVLNIKEEVTAGGNKASLGIGLTLIGSAE